MREEGKETKFRPVVPAAQCPWLSRTHTGGLPPSDRGWWAQPVSELPGGMSALSSMPVPSFLRQPPEIVGRIMYGSR